MDPLVLQIIGVLAALFFIFLLVMCWKTWRIAHILFAFLVFGVAATFLFFASFVLKTHAAWRSLYVRFDSALVKAEEENDWLKRGKLNAGGEPEPSVRELEAELSDTIIDRGRVWRECTLAQPVDQDTFRVRTIPASLPQGVQPEPSGITEKQILQVFAEQENADGIRVPTTYLGEFTVEQATDTEITISAVLPLDAFQLQTIQQAGSTWCLYELMPIDAHEPFAWFDPGENRLVGMDLEEIKKVIPNSYNAPAAVFEKRLQGYARFDREATEDDPPANVWLLVEFLKPHKIQVDSDAEQSQLENNDFDSAGRAQVGRLRRGEEGTVEFEVGQTAIFDLETATKLVEDGICRSDKRLFRRELNDYQFVFHEAVLLHSQLDDAIRRAQRDTDEMVALKVRAEEHVVYHQMEKVKLEEDLLKFKQEQADATRYSVALDAEWLKMRQRLSALYARNNELADELARLQVQMANEINRRAVQATAQSTAASPAAAP